MKRLFTIMMVIAIAMIPVASISSAAETDVEVYEIDTSSNENISDNNVVRGETGTYWSFAKSSEKKYFSTKRATKVSADY